MKLASVLITLTAALIAVAAPINFDFDGALEARDLSDSLIQRDEMAPAMVARQFDSSETQLERRGKRGGGKGGKKGGRKGGRNGGGGGGGDGGMEERDLGNSESQFERRAGMGGPKGPVKGGGGGGHATCGAKARC